MPASPLPWRAAVDRWLAGHHGIISIGQAVRLGAPERAVRRAVERGELIRVQPGVLRSRAWPDDRIQRMTAALARNEAGLLAFVTAAEIWDARRLPHDRRIHLLVPHRCSPQMDGIVVHRCRRIDPVDATERDGLRVTSPPRTLFDVAHILGPSAAASVLEQMIERGMGTFGTHLDTWLRLGHPRRPGTRTMAAVLRSRPAWRSALQSDLEARVLDELRRQLLPVPEVQWPMRLPSGRDIRVDFAWPALRIALEVDHPFWHAGYEEWRKDRSRDRELLRLGWLVPRLTDLEVGGGLERAVADVAAVVALRTAA